MAEEEVRGRGWFVLTLLAVFAVGAVGSCLLERVQVGHGSLVERDQVEMLPYPGHVEQDDRTVTMEIGGRVIVSEWYDTIGLSDGVPLTEGELRRRWEARDGTVFRVVPRGETPRGLVEVQPR